MRLNLSVLSKAVCLSAAFVAQFASAAVLSTTNYVIVVAERCEEGDVSCNDVVYTGVSKKTAQSITLKGKALSRMCADGVTPCQHLGWQFKNGKTIYTVLEASGELTISEGNKVLGVEKGRWID